MTDTPPAPVIPRPAASLLVLRNADAPEVLMGMRGAGHKFMPNRLVFPGGAVDPEDHTATFATPLAENVRMRLEKGADPSLAQALAIAAARELEEETGLTLGGPPSLHGLDYLARAVTPPEVSRRFDARFLVVDAAHVTGTLAGSGELDDLAWYGLDAALALDLAIATRGVLEKLLDWMALSEAERATRMGVPALYNRAWIIE